MLVYLWSTAELSVILILVGIHEKGKSYTWSMRWCLEVKGNAHSMTLNRRALATIPTTDTPFCEFCFHETTANSKYTRAHSSLVRTKSCLGECTTFFTNIRSYLPSMGQFGRQKLHRNIDGNIKSMPEN